MKATLQALRRLPLFSDLTDEEVALLSEHALVKEYVKNDTIISKHEEGDTVFSLLSGRVKIVLTDDEGKEFIVGILGEGEFFGELALLDGKPRSATVVALEETQAVALSRKDFIEQLERTPSLCIKVMMELARRLRYSNEQIGSLAFLDVCGRLARILLDMAKDQDQELHDDISIKVAYSRTELSNLVGTTRETLTRALKTLESMGYIKIDTPNRGVFLITNFKGLSSRVC